MQLAFLTYQNRSGSTYLASRLAKFEAICVGIEARFRDGWITPGYDIDSHQKLSQYLDALYKDSKFCSWGIGQDKMERALQHYDFPIKFSAVLCEALRLYCGSVDKEMFIHKCGAYYRCIEAIREELPGAKFIFIERDPRAIYNSQTRTLDSGTQRPMQTNILHFLFSYLDTQHILTSLQDDGDFLRVQYETLVQNEEQVLDDIVSFLGVSQKKSRDNNCYFSRVPDDQKSLHLNVAEDAPVKTRLSGWQVELPTVDVLLLQDVLRHHLRVKKYDIYKPKQITLFDWFRYIVLRMLFTYEKVKRRLFRIAHKY